MMTSVVVQAHGPIDSPEDAAAVKSAWEQSLAQHPDSAGAHWGLGICVEQKDPARALALFRRGRTLAADAVPDIYLDAMTTIYAAAVITDLNIGDSQFQLNGITMDLNTATALRNELEASSDPALLSHVGRLLVSLARSPDHDSQSNLGIDYLQRAVDLDPGNSKWTAALEAAKAEPARRRAYAALLKTQQFPGGTVRIGAAVAAANLVKRVDPEYPPLAVQARIQGTVEFNVVIGPDGHVTSMRLVRGHPLLVSAAQKAVLQWVYRPTLLNGKPVAVTTELMVPFRLPE